MRDFVFRGETQNQNVETTVDGTNQEMSTLANFSFRGETQIVT